MMLNISQFGARYSCIYLLRTFGSLKNIIAQSMNTHFVFVVYPISISIQVSHSHFNFNFNTFFLFLFFVYTFEIQFFFWVLFSFRTLFSINWTINWNVCAENGTKQNEIERKILWRIKKKKKKNEKQWAERRREGESKGRSAAKGRGPIESRPSWKNELTKTDSNEFSVNIFMRTQLNYSAKTAKDTKDVQLQIQILIHPQSVFAHCCYCLRIIVILLLDFDVLAAL